MVTASCWDDTLPINIAVPVTIEEEWRPKYIKIFGMGQNYRAMKVVLKDENAIIDSITVSAADDGSILAEATHPFDPNDPTVEEELDPAKINFVDKRYYPEPYYATIDGLDLIAKKFSISVTDTKGHTYTGGPYTYWTLEDIDVVVDSPENTKGWYLLAPEGYQWDPSLEDPFNLNAPAPFDTYIDWLSNQN